MTLHATSDATQKTTRTLTLRITLAFTAGPPTDNSAHFVDDHCDDLTPPAAVRCNALLCAGATTLSDAIDTAGTDTPKSEDREGGDHSAGKNEQPNLPYGRVANAREQMRPNTERNQGH